jgi:sn1-specific diacylglycerol lipase
LLEDDIIYFSLENGICQVPFFVVFDRKKRAVVVALRGTLSANDFVTDFFGYAEPILISTPTGGKAHYAHKGFLQTAMWVKERLSL